MRVDTGSLIHVDRNVYSVDSRLIGEHVEVRLYAEHLEVWYAQKRVDHLPRLRGRNKHRIAYRHIIDGLVRKPGAFENYRYRDDLFPNSRFRMAYDALRETAGAGANKAYLQILHLAARESESGVDVALRWLIEHDQPIDPEAVTARVQDQARIPPVTDVKVDPANPADYDVLLEAREVA